MPEHVVKIDGVATVDEYRTGIYLQTDRENNSGSDF
jgi:hypothetical protein